MTPEIRQSLSVISVKIPSPEGGFLKPSIESERTLNDERISSAVEGIFSPRSSSPSELSIFSNVSSHGEVQIKCDASAGQENFLSGPVISHNLTEQNQEGRINIDDLRGKFWKIVEKSNKIISKLNINDSESLLEEDEYEEDEWETSSDTCFYIDMSQDHPKSPISPIRRSGSEPSLSQADSYFRELMENEIENETEKDKKKLQALTEQFLIELSISLRFFNISEIYEVWDLVNGIDSLNEESFNDPEFLKICIGAVINNLKSITTNEDDDEVLVNDRKNLAKQREFHVALNITTERELSESDSDDSSLSEEGFFLDFIATIWRSVKALFVNNN